MSENQELERGVIPKGTRVKLYEDRVTLLEDVVVDANQEWIDKAIKDQDDYFNGISMDCEQSPTYESLSIHGKKEFAENRSISCKNLID